MIKTSLALVHESERWIYCLVAISCFTLVFGITYVGWCCRAFYLKPTEFGGDVNGVPEDVMEVVYEWHEVQTILGPEPFRLEEFVWLIRHPMRSEPLPVEMIMNGGYHIIQHPSLSNHPKIKELLVVEGAGNDGSHAILVSHEELGEIPFSKYVEVERR